MRPFAVSTDDDADDDDVSLLVKTTNDKCKRCKKEKERKIHQKNESCTEVNNYKKNELSIRE